MQRLHELKIYQIYLFSFLSLYLSLSIFLLKVHWIFALNTYPFYITSRILSHVLVPPCISVGRVDFVIPLMLDLAICLALANGMLSNRRGFHGLDNIMVLFGLASCATIICHEKSTFQGAAAPLTWTPA